MLSPPTENLVEKDAEDEPLSDDNDSDAHANLPPREFDTIVTNNIFSYILSDEASMITGSIRMLPSTSIGDSGPGVYELIHGSAPDIAGMDKANPLATVLSAAMLLKYYCLGEEKVAQQIELALLDTLNSCQFILENQGVLAPSIVVMRLDLTLRFMLLMRLLALSVAVNFVQLIKQMFWRCISCRGLLKLFSIGQDELHGITSANVILEFYFGPGVYEPMIGSVHDTVEMEKANSLAIVFCHAFKVWSRRGKGSPSSRTCSAGYSKQGNSYW